MAGCCGPRGALARQADPVRFAEKFGSEIGEGEFGAHPLPVLSRVTGRAIAYVISVVISVVSTGARSAERRDLVSTISRFSWREGLSARACGPRSRRQNGHMR